MNYNEQNEPKYNAGPIETVTCIIFAMTLCYCIYMFIMTYFDLRNIGRINRKEISQTEYEQLDQLIKENPSIKSIVSERMDDNKISNSEFAEIQEMKFKSRLKYPE